MSIDATIGRIREAGEEPGIRVHRDGPTPFPLRCRVISREPPGEPAADWRFPGDLAWLWLHTEEMRLFEDVRYGQWGLVFLDRETAERRTSEERARRPGDIQPGDIVVAEFLGDSDLLVVRTEPQAEDFGSVLVALPLDRRQYWPVVGPSLSAFLDRYVSAQGDKYWEA